MSARGTNDRSLERAAALLLASLGVLGAAPGCSSVVGARCLPGWIACDGECVEPEVDPENCGGCGLVCAPGERCEGARCESRDAGLGDAGDAGRLDGAPDARPSTDDVGLADTRWVDGDAPSLDVAESDGAVGDVGALDVGTGLDAGVDVDGALTDDVGGSLDGGADRADAGLDGGGSEDAGAPVDGGDEDGGDEDGGDEDGGDEDGAAADAGASLDAGGDAAAATDAGPAADAPPCVAPAVLCGGACADLALDPDHCGACGRTCPTGLCVAARCELAYPGHVVVIGHDYEISRAAMRPLVGNAVLLARSEPVRVLVWEGASSAAARAGTDAAIEGVAASVARTWSRTVAATPVELVALLDVHDVMLVYAQRDATDDQIDALGASVASALASFVAAGGVVVVLDTSTPSNSGTCRVLGPSGLFGCGDVVGITGARLTLVAPGDLVAAGVPLAYRAERTTVRFTSWDGTTVVTDGVGPVVVHRVGGL